MWSRGAHLPHTWCSSASPLRPGPCRPRLPRRPRPALRPTLAAPAWRHAADLGPLLGYAGRACRAITCRSGWVGGSVEPDQPRPSGTAGADQTGPHVASLPSCRRQSQQVVRTWSGGTRRGEHWLGAREMTRNGERCARPSLFKCDSGWIPSRTFRRLEIPGSCA